MQNTLTKLIPKLMREYADKIESGACELSFEEQSDILSAITHRALSKTQACDFVNLQSSRFDELIRNGVIPRGRKRKGFKELVWYEDELRTVINRK